MRSSKAGSKSIEIPEVARVLETMEENESNLFADRMKDRGMSWTIQTLNEWIDHNL